MRCIMVRACLHRGLAHNPGKNGEEEQLANIAFGYLREQINGRERWEENLGDGESGTGADALGRGGG